MKSPSDSLNQQLKAMLIERFQGVPLETRLPSFRALAQEMDVAYLTISGVMKQLEWEGYIKRIPRKGTFLASRERTVQRDLQTGTSKLKTLIFAYPNYFSYATWIRLHHAEELAVKSGMAMVEFKMNPGTTYDGLRELARRRDDVSGIILIPIPGTVARREVAMLGDLGVPVVLLSPCEYVSLEKQVWAVGADDYRAGYLQARLLIEAGHERIAFVEHEPFASDRQQLVIKGMRQAIREAGMKQRQLMTVGGSTRPWQDSRKAAEQLTRELLEKRRATAAVYESLRGMQGALRVAREAEVVVPDEFSIVGIGLGNGDEDYLSPPVTTVDPQPEMELKLAFQCLLRPQTTRSRQQWVEPVLCGRRSVAPPAAVIVANGASSLVK